MLCGCGAKEGVERAAEWAGAEQAMREEGKEVGGARWAAKHAKAEKGWKRRAGLVPRVGIKRKKRRFFKIKFFSISSFQN